MTAYDSFTRASGAYVYADRLRARGMPLSAWNEVAELPRPSRLAKIIAKTVVGALVLVASAWGVAWVVAVWP